MKEFASTKIKKKNTTMNGVFVSSILYTFYLFIYLFFNFLLSLR